MPAITPTAALPAIVELDPDTSEANGAIHWFCSEQCRDAASSDHVRDIQSRGFVAEKTGMPYFCDDAICQKCLKPL